MLVKVSHSTTVLYQEIYKINNKYLRNCMVNLIIYSVNSILPLNMNISRIYF